MTWRRLMRRREFITLLGGAAAAWPLVARAQQGVPVVGYLDGGGAAARDSTSSAAFRKGLSEMGYVQGRNVAIEFRGSEHYEQLSAMALEFVRRQVAVIYAAGTANSALAA